MLDAQGSTRYLTNKAGDTVSSSFRYDAYGQRTFLGGTSSDNYPTEYQYAGAYGYQTEPTTGDGLDLQYLYQRYYDPQAGRFITRDPIRWAGGTNLYGYVGNNPVNGVDPTGLKITAVGSAAFKDAVADTLIQISGAGPFGRKLVSDLLYNPAITVTIKPGTGVDKATTLAAVGGGKPCGSTISIDIAGKPFSGNGVKFTPLIALAHELGHAWLIAKFGDASFKFGAAAWEVGEVGATVIENDIRSEHRAGLGSNWWRSYYTHPMGGPFKIPIPSGMGGGQSWGYHYRSAPVSFTERLWMQ